MTSKFTIFSSVVPILVPRRDLSGAISLNSVQMNASRVVGPLIGSTIYAQVVIVNSAGQALAASGTGIKP